MNEAEQLLSQLRDVQEPIPPEGISVVLIAANVLLLVVVLTILIARWRRKREGWRREAIASIAKARKHGPQSGLLSLAKLLRQIMHHRGRSSATMDGQAWLAELDQEFDTQWFSQDAGRIFGDTLYMKLTPETINLNSLCDRLTTLIKSLPAKPAKTSKFDTSVTSSTSAPAPPDSSDSSDSSASPASQSARPS